MIYKNDFVKFEFKNDNTILLITTLKDIPTRDEYTNFLEQFSNIYEALFQKKKIFSLLIDITELGIIPLTYINELRNFFIERKNYTVQCLKCTSIITNNSAIKNIFNSFFLIYSTIKPVSFVNNIDKGIEFINSISMGDILNTDKLTI